MEAERNARSNAAPTTGFRPEPLAVWVRAALLAYEALWLLGVAAWLIVSFLRSGFRFTQAMRERLGGLPRRPPLTPAALWVHAVSVGEVISLRPVLAALRRRHPDWWILVTTSHPHAHAEATAQPSGADRVCWFPWDAGFCVRRALRRVRPDCLILAECELWPQLLRQSAQQAVPVLMLNARIYERDFGRYRLGSSLFGPLLRGMACIGTQSEPDRERLLRLGAKPAAVRFVGNTKFDGAAAPADPVRSAALRKAWCFRGGPVWALASTHADEEEQILRQCRALWTAFPGLQLLIAPRHPERVPQLKRQVEAHGLICQLRSRLPTHETQPPQVVVLDTVGELAMLLPLADLVFVGGSLVDRGGQTPLEAAGAGKAILMGPSHRNFAAAVELLKAEQAIKIVGDAAALAVEAGRLLRDAAQRRDMGQRAAAVVARNRGAAEEYVRLIEGIVEQKPGRFASALRQSKRCA